MSLVEEPSHENNQKEAKIRLQEDDETNDFDPEDQKDKNMSMKDLLKTSQSDKRSISPLSLLKEDFSQFKEEVLKVFRDKDTKTEREDSPSSQAENKPASSALSVLKEDFKHFKDDLSNVFRIGLSKESDNKGVTAKEESSNTLKVKVSKAERSDEAFNPLSLFRRDQKLLQTCQTAENSQGGEKTSSEKDEEQMDDCFRGNLSEQDEETVDGEKINNMKTTMNKVEDSERDISVSEEKTETQQSEEMIPTSPAAEQRCESEEQSDDSSVVSAEDQRINEEKPSETLLWESLSAGISLFNMRDPIKDDTREKPGGDLWWVKNFACYLTFDPNTANSELHLTDCNRKATRVWSDHRSSDHPDRFARCPQVLCREGLLDPVYWEVVWSGGADIGITYNSIPRDGDTASCLLGHNEQSWSLECSEGIYTPCHNGKRFRSSSPQPFTHRVGVYLDWCAGSLSFYCVSQDTMVHLHTFTSTFTEPVFPGFWVWAYDGSVSLSQVELDWERLLQ
ncbi:stonustoxin subunit alpha-like [Siniperca chuatsi]|uniref:stonustoxin subunit alpha-like n=1 Tax=Siniperca chuatsi TaxID=119488 RepID=UPI001CE165BD|nr:stonustoxin subunit alpha-like [Siniperca chuatsi]